MATRAQLLEANTNPDAVAYKGFTHIQLHEAFEKVQNKLDWKYPIVSEIFPEALPVTLAAIEFFTGGGAQATRTKTNMLLIQAKGYYHHTNEDA